MNKIEESVEQLSKVMKTTMDKVINSDRDTFLKLNPVKEESELKELTEFEIIKDKLKVIQNENTKYNNEKYILERKYLELLQDKCKENIGRCFKKIQNGEVISYCRIINIDKAIPQMRGNPLFNECQYPSIWFKYPYNNSKIPFYENDLFSGAWGNGNDILGKCRGIEYEEISSEEFIEKFEEVNELWVDKIKGVK